MNWQRWIKFGHSAGAIGTLGAIAALLILHATMPPIARDGGTFYLQQRDVMDAIARWMLLPSMALTLVSGLGSMAVVRVFQNAGWAWLKLGTGVLMFEGTLLGVQGPIQREAILARRVVDAGAELSTLGLRLDAEYASLWLIGAVALANVALAVFRPRFGGRGLFASGGG